MKERTVQIKQIKINSEIDERDQMRIYQLTEEIDTIKKTPAHLEKQKQSLLSTLRNLCEEPSKKDRYRRLKRRLFVVDDSPNARTKRPQDQKFSYDPRNSLKKHTRYEEGYKAIVKKDYPTTGEFRKLFPKYKEPDEEEDGRARRRRCRSLGVIPNYLRIKPNIKSPHAHRIYHRAGLALVREQIQTTRSKLDTISKQLLKLHLFLSNTLPTHIWNLLDQMYTRYAEKQKEHISNTQIQKINRLKPPTATTQPDHSKTVINLSTHHISTPAISALAKGQNFAITPNRIPVEDIITRVEATIQLLPSATAEEIRSETVHLLKRTKPPKTNIPPKELQAIKNLKRNQDIIILPADKGNATVILNKTDYQEKMEQLLENSTYTKTKKDPTQNILRNLRKELDKSKSDSTSIHNLIPRNAQTPRIYGLPKIHKTGVPLRPTAISRIKLTDDDLLVSFDVESLFTNVPIDDTLKLLEPHFDHDTLSLFKICLTSSYFQ
ncbi:UNVERIFIED_CONTAM: hypothetical protein PYX00_006992 [Menopon gallinae]|uniref:Reverse transcriptase domain-containing protein n=1 Tax=Menopon gallinae TaxID=328185 RepID=A0AAW2HH64_9NEOP